MKTKTIRFSLLALALSLPLLSGCIAFPPLIQVEHKENPNSNQEVLRRLDAIDQRLNQLEQKQSAKQ
jgi:starvation-inducible outer membrane lipoprotein